MVDGKNLQVIIHILLSDEKSSEINVPYIKRKSGLSRSQVIHVLRNLKYGEAINYNEIKSRKDNKTSNMIITSINPDKLMEMQKKNSIKKVIHHMNKYKVPYMILIITIFSTLIIGLYIKNKDFPPEDPRSSRYFSIEFIPLSSQNIFINNDKSSDFDFIYHLVHKGNNCLTEGKLFYHLIEQINNTCGNNISFFNKTNLLHILCRTQEVGTDPSNLINEFCYPYISYICEERKT